MTVPVRLEHAPISLTSAPRAALLRASTSTLKPFFANCNAYSRPMPSDAPVTTAHAPFPAPYFFSYEKIWTRNLSDGPMRHLDNGTYAFAGEHESLQQHAQKLDQELAEGVRAEPEQDGGQKRVVGHLQQNEAASATCHVSELVFLPKTCDDGVVRNGRKSWTLILIFGNIRHSREPNERKVGVEAERRRPLNSSARAQNSTALSAWFGDRVQSNLDSSLSG